MDEWRKRLRALAALEVEMDQFVAEEVGAARGAGLSWDAVAEAVGVSRPSAWRRWKTVVEDPRPTRPQRRDGRRLVLDEADAAVVLSLTDTLARRVMARHARHPWASAVRSALDQLHLAFDVVQRGARETEFHVRTVRLQITCLEAEPGNEGGVSTVVYPSAESSLSEGAQPRGARLRADDAMENDQIEAERIMDFIRAQADVD